MTKYPFLAALLLFVVNPMNAQINIETINDTVKFDNGFF